MKVWIVESGCYENRGIAGIYDSPERAMGHYPNEKWTHTVWTHYPKYPDLSEIGHHDSWQNEKDWDGALEIRGCELTNTGPLAEPAPKYVQTLNATGGWDYVLTPATE